MHNSRNKNHRFIFIDTQFLMKYDMFTWIIIYVNMTYRSLPGRETKLWLLYFLLLSFDDQRHWNISLSSQIYLCSYSQQ